jgi:hypothetical protein
MTDPFADMQAEIDRLRQELRDLQALYAHDGEWAAGQLRMKHAENEKLRAELAEAKLLLMDAAPSCMASVKETNEWNARRNRIVSLEEWNAKHRQPPSGQAEQEKPQ